MVTTRLVIVLIVLAALVLLAVQNSSPSLALAFLGWRTVALPLAVWILGAIALGGLTSLFLAGLLSFNAPPPVRKSQRHGRGPSGPSQRSWTAAPTPAEPPPGATESAQTGGESTSFTGETPPANSEWQDWNNVSSPSQWEDWDKTRRQSSPEASQRRGGRGRQKEAARIDESWQELAQGWEGVERPPTIARGVSPVEDSLEDITRGWQDSPAPARDKVDAATDPRTAAREYESPKAPKRVYQSGSLYSYGYRDQDAAPVQDSDDDEDLDDEDSLEAAEPHDVPAYEYEEDYEDEETDPPQRPSTPGPDGVYDADYRVIIPPHRPLDDDEP